MPHNTMTKAEKQHLNSLSDYGCVVCRWHLGLFSPPEIHHPRFLAGAGQKAKHRDAIPLCHSHHRTGGYGVAIHAGQIEREKNYGTEAQLLERLKHELE